MDAAACVGVAPPALLSRSFADAAIARALHFSLCDDYSRLPDPEPPHHSVVATDDVLGACGAGALHSEHTVVLPRLAPPPSSSARCRLGPAGGGRAGKRRARPSKRAPTTYISTDASTFRLMVQQVTGAQVVEQQVGDACFGLLMPPPFDVVEVEPALLASDPAERAAAYIPRPLPASAPAEQPCFPTLDSWNVMYGKEDEAV